MKYSRMLMFLSISLAIALLFLLAGPLGAGDRAQAKKSTPAQTVDTSKYVGAETCKGCHEDAPSKNFYKNFEATPHWKTTLGAIRGAEGHGCESCHGPGADHVSGGGDKSKIFSFKGKSTKEISERCLECHEYGEEHSNFRRSQHNMNNVSCIQCHSVHNAKQAQFLLVQKQPQLCFSCHVETKPDFNKPFRHRVNENLLKCTDCHNQHGGFLTKQLRSTAAQDQVCFKCHVDKAGPFVFEHHGVRSEGCVSCHTPHGSSNPRLLKRSQVNLLCLECHTPSAGPVEGAPGVPSFHNQTQKYQACTMCHAQIHGSNFDRFFFK